MSEQTFGDMPPVHYNAGNIIGYCGCEDVCGECFECWPCEASKLQERRLTL